MKYKSWKRPFSFVSRGRVVQVVGNFGACKGTEVRSPTVLTFLIEDILFLSLPFVDWFASEMVAMVAISS